ncbi:MAG TPA: tyrosine-type recombinase/integrase [Bacteroidia bacterium]|jgi:integrase/recombinase XerD|nr:tyrosine-type recombinase/integrase [Bacteroidia bacterium]
MKQLPIKNKTYIALYEDFCKGVSAQGYNTAEWCSYPAWEFLFFLETKGIENVRDVKAAEIIAYYEYLRERPNIIRGGLLSEKSIRHHLYSVCLFFDHLIATARIEKSPARLPKFLFGSSKEQPVLTKEEIKELYANTNNRLVIAILGLAYGCGLRYKEMKNLDVRDVLFHKGILNVRAGKNNKSRTVSMSEKVMKDLKEYLVYERIRRINPEKPCNGFILNKFGNRFEKCTINHHYLKGLARKTGNKTIIAKNIHLHMLRHSITTHLIEAGAPLDFVRRMLGHEMLDTTIMYAKRRKLRLNNKLNTPK